VNLSPTVRTVLTFLAATLGALIPVLATLGVSVILLAVAGAIVVGLAAIGIIPPQTGGTQVGVVSPAIGTPPAIDTEPVDSGNVAVPFDVESEPEVEAYAPKYDRRHGLGDGPAVAPEQQRPPGYDGSAYPPPVERSGP
jgi:hypothetical protein